MTENKPEQTDEYRGIQEMESVGRLFFGTLVLVLGIFFGYEVLERFWLLETYPEWIDTFHIMRGVSTTLIVGFFLFWYFLTKSLHRTVRNIFFTSMRTEQEQNEQIRERLGEWFTRFRWVVSAFFLLGLILSLTVVHDLLWEPNFLALGFLGLAITGANILYVYCHKMNFGYARQLPYQIGMDFLFMTIFLQYTGGVENPAYMLYFLHVIMGGVVFSAAGAWVCFLGAFGLFSLLALGQYFGMVPHYDFVFFHPQAGDYFNDRNFLFGMLLSFGGVGGAATYLTTLVVGTLRKYRQRLSVEKKRSDQLVEKLFDVREEERARVSRELHDQIGQSLSAIRLNIANGPEGNKEAWTRRISDRMADAIEEVRDLSHQLRPPSLDECGLACAIENYAEEVEKHYDVVVDYEYIGVEHSRNFSLSLDTAIYRISQEAIHNAVEHGNPDHVSVILQKTGEQIQVMVDDDGTGFDTSILNQAGRDTLGIQGMKERVELLEGTFTLESSPGEGTRVRAEIPIDRGEEP